MNIILMTVLLTLLGAGLVVLLVWLSVASWKGIRYRRSSMKDIENLEQKIEIESTELGKRLNEAILQSERQNSDLVEYTINPVTTEIYNTLEQNKKYSEEMVNNLNRYMDEWIKENDRRNDSRFDKLQQSVKDLKTDIFNIETRIKK